MAAESQLVHIGELKLICQNAADRLDQAEFVINDLKPSFRTYLNKYKGTPMGSNISLFIDSVIHIPKGEFIINLRKNIKDLEDYLKTLDIQDLTPLSSVDEQIIKVMTRINGGENPIIKPYKLYEDANKQVVIVAICKSWWDNIICSFLIKKYTNKGLLLALPDFDENILLQGNYFDTDVLNGYSKSAFDETIIQAKQLYGGLKTRVEKIFNATRGGSRKRKSRRKLRKLTSSKRRTKK